MRICFLVLGLLLVFAHSAQSGGAVAKVKARKNPHIKMHVQVPTPRLHVIQQPFIEASPVIHTHAGVLPAEASVMKTPETQYQSQVLSTEKPDIQTEFVGKSVANEQNVVDFRQLAQSLHGSSQAWMLIVNDQDKEVVVQEFMNKFGEVGIKINKPAAHYVDFIDAMAQRSPPVLDLPFERVLEVAAVMEYDFDNGQNKDVLARKVLGEQIYEKNKERQLADSADNQSGQP